MIPIAKLTEWVDRVLAPTGPLCPPSRNHPL